MGLVYRAEDTRLRRTVALKLLPPTLASDGVLRDRFLREAQAAAALNHPNICTVYEIDEEHSLIAMECIDGPSLKQKIAERPLPLDEAIRIAGQAGEGLQAAHEKGIVHRDIKPANILLTEKGQVKVSDFGLAAVSDRTRLTGTGTAMGTPAYMSPEQARGEPADRRSDIWSLGVVLYEMVTGRLPFRGESEAAVVRGILDTEPEPPTALRSGLPVALDRVIRKTLAKNAGDRYQHVDDLLVDLRRVADAPSAAPPRPVGRAREWIVWGSAAACAAIAAMLWFRPEPGQPTISLTLDAAEEGFRSPGMLAVSPDGSTLAFAAADEAGKRHIFLRSLAAKKAQVLPGTEGGTQPFWSPDGRHIGFFGGGKLRRVPLAGGPVQDICDAMSGRGASWNTAGDIILQPDSRLPLFRVPATGGSRVPVTRLEPSRDENSHRYPQFLPDGRRFLYTARASPEHTGIYAASLDSTEARRILAVASNGVYTPFGDGKGHLLFVRGGVLYAQPFDERSLQLKGDAVVIAEGVGFVATASSATFHASADGRTLAYVSGEFGVVQLTWSDRSGKPLGEVGPRAYIHGSRISPDDRRIVFSMRDPFSDNRDIWLLESPNPTPQRITLDSNNDWQPVWSSDGRRILFNSDRQGGVGRAFVMDSTGASVKPLLERDGEGGPVDWSADGKLLCFFAERGLWLQQLEGRHEPVRFLEARYGEIDAKFSPDGKWVAFPSNKSGRFEVYLRPVDASQAGDTQISVGGGAMPRWRRDGRELFYRAPDGSMMLVEFSAAGEPASPKKLFQTCLRGNPIGWWESNYDVTSDGQRFLMQCPAVDEDKVKIHIVVNWQGLLKPPAQTR